MRNDPPPVNVFDEPASSQPPRKPMVVEIEDVQSMPPADQQSSVLPPPTVVSVDTPMQQPAMQPQQQLPSFDQSNLQIPTGQSFPGTIPVPQSYGAPTQPMAAPPVQAPVQQAGDPVLPAFFEQDLRGTNPSVQMPGNVSPASVPNAGAPVGMQPPFDGSLPQAAIGEMAEMHEGGDMKKKIIGIIFVVIALIILLAGILMIYAKKLSSPLNLPESSPTPLVTQPTSDPTPVLSPTPTASGSATASPSAELTALKKKYKVDVLNGTKVAGLAAKGADILKKQGYTLGTVGNGTAANAGTIVSASASADLAKDIQKQLSDFTFTLKTDSKATNVVVTLGDEK